MAIIAYMLTVKNIFERMLFLPGILLAPSVALSDSMEKDIEHITNIGKLAKSIVMTFVWIVLAVAVIAVAVVLFRRYMAQKNIENLKSDAEMTREEIADLMQKRNYAGAARIYERMNSPEQAAKLYMRGQQFSKAGKLYEQLGKNDLAIENYMKSGESLRAASLHIKLKNYFEAAKIFKNKGDRIRAAQALEMYGNKLGAAKEYKEAGEYLKAAKLYKDLNLYPEVTDMFRLMLENKDVDESTAGQFYMYGSFLELIDRNDEAVTVFRKVYAYDPSFRDAGERIRQLAPDEILTAPPEQAAETETSPEVAEDTEAVISDAAEAYAEAVKDLPEPDSDDIESLIEQEIARRDGIQAPTETGTEGESGPAEKTEVGSESLKHSTTLKNMIRSGSLEPRYAMKLWMEVLRALKKMHDRQKFIGVLSPHTIHVDMENNISIEPPAVPPSIYLSPEFVEGAPADALTDIYSAGVLLFEMATGSLDDFGVKDPSQVNSEVPEWLDEIVLRCTETERDRRYQGLDDIYSKLLELRDKM
jgi:tetratricopeptide (TPR) repeat protein